MKRHRFDPLSFSFGAGFLAIVGLMLTTSIDVAAPGLRWIGAGFLLLLGLLLVVTSGRRSKDES